MKMILDIMSSLSNIVSPGTQILLGEANVNEKYFFYNEAMHSLEAEVSLSRASHLSS
jgi:hypothetical protein